MGPQINTPTLHYKSPHIIHETKKIMYFDPQLNSIFKATTSHSEKYLGRAIRSNAFLQFLLNALQFHMAFKLLDVSYYISQTWKFI
jgi:hypothetical protein